MDTKSSVTPVRILLIDDDRGSRELMRNVILKNNPDLQVIAEAKNFQEALDHLEKQEIELIVMDYQLYDYDLRHTVNGPDLTRLIRKQYPEIKIIFLSMYFYPLTVKWALEAGANGYLSKEAEPEIIIAEIRKIMGLPSTQLEVPVSILDKLTIREGEVFKLEGEAKSSKEINMIFWVNEQIENFYIEERSNIDLESVSREVASYAKKAAESFRKDIRYSGYLFERECAGNLAAGHPPDVLLPLKNDAMTQTFAELNQWIQKQYEDEQEKSHIKSLIKIYKKQCSKTDQEEKKLGKVIQKKYRMYKKECKDKSVEPETRVNWIRSQGNNNENGESERRWAEIFGIPDHTEEYEFKYFVKWIGIENDSKERQVWIDDQIIAFYLKHSFDDLKEAEDYLKDVRLKGYKYRKESYLEKLKNADIKDLKLKNLDPWIEKQIKNKASNINASFEEEAKQYKDADDYDGEIKEGNEIEIEIEIEIEPVIRNNKVDKDLSNLGDKLNLSHPELIRASQIFFGSPGVEQAIMAQQLLDSFSAYQTRKNDKSPPKRLL